MKQYEVRILETANEDLKEIYFYIAMDSQTSALKLTDQIMEQILILSTFPLKGKIVPDTLLSRQEFRMIVVRNYIVFYKVIDDIVYVYRVLHGQRDYPNLL